MKGDLRVAINCHKEACKNWDDEEGKCILEYVEIYDGICQMKEGR